MNLNQLEIELKKRLDFPYTWGTRQSDDLDKKTAFIYDCKTFEELENKTNPLSENEKNYAFNRWLNFWSAKGIEEIFCSHWNVKPNKNPYDKFIDFSINGIPFDHKTSIFPKAYNQKIEFAFENKRNLIEWLYENQSREGRMHFKNRLFVVLFNAVERTAHWKLKAEILMMKQKIDLYLKNFDALHLEEFNFEGTPVYSDIIWIIK